MDYRIPEPRPIVNRFKKNVILVGGKSAIGKTNICKMLYNDNVGYISLDKYNDLNLAKINEIEKIIESGVDVSNYPFERIILNNLDKYVTTLIGHINEIPKGTILIDGVLCENKEFKDAILNSVNLNVWDLNKIKNVNK